MFLSVFLFANSIDVNRFVGDWEEFTILKTEGKCDIESKCLCFHIRCNNIDVTEIIERIGEQSHEHSRILPRIYRKRGSA